MARQYSPKHVLRHLPLLLIRDFLHKQSINTGVQWDALVEGDTNALHQAWCNLAPQNRAGVEMMLRQVHEMATAVASGVGE